MKFFRKHRTRNIPENSPNRRTSLRRRGWIVLVAGLIVIGSAFAGWADLPNWLQNIEAHTVIDAAFFRTMNLPGGPVAMRRPPAETVSALSDALHTQPANAELYSLRALANEQELDFEAAEADWKSNFSHSADKAAAGLALADFYHRRLRPLEEVNALLAVGKLPPTAAENLFAQTDERSWHAFERILKVINVHLLGKDVSIQTYKAWIDRYPTESSVYGRYFEYLLAQQDYAAAAQVITSYQKAFPADTVFPVKAEALLKYRQSGVEQGLAVYDKSFQPLWPSDLVKDYFDLLQETGSLPKFLDHARAALAKNPEDLNAVTRIFYYYQQQGKLEAAQKALSDYRLRKEQKNSRWSAEELYTFARLLEEVRAYPESVRYYYALYNSDGSADSQEKSLAAITDILLTAPEEPIRLGSGELSLYSDVAALDNGPGFLNGILSLFFNTTSPSQQLSEEERRAEPYFHRSYAAELLVLFDGKFPHSVRRAELHAKLIAVYENYGQNDAVINAGTQFLKDFPDAGQRTTVALQVASAYARAQKKPEELAIYDMLLRELAQKALGIPLGEHTVSGAVAGGTSEPLNPEQAAEREDHGQAQDATTNQSETDSTESDANQEAEGEQSAQKGAAQKKAFSVNTQAAHAEGGPRSPEYQDVLNRYLARLVEFQQIAQAVAVLRAEIDRNPNDPGLYEHLAEFLDQNRLGAEQEAVYQRALQQFPDKTWYHKLARWYIRYEKRQEFDKLTQQVVKSFAGSDLERYVADVQYGFDGMNVRINQYAHERFPHNLVFVRNLLNSYRVSTPCHTPAWKELIRQHWFEDASLRNEFFACLSYGGQLDAELAALNDQGAKKDNPGAMLFVAEVKLWQSHFEESAAPLAAIAAQYPGDAELGRRTSSVFRSLAAYDPRNTELAVSVEKNLLKIDPANYDIMERVGDIYADREMFDEAAPYWKRIPSTAPGESSGYLESATVFWDYYHFDDALQMLDEGRTKLKNPTLYAYEAGAVYEDKREYSRAIDEYLKGALAGNENAKGRLLQLANRPALKATIEAVTAKAGEASDADMKAINLRIAILEAQARHEELVNFLTGILNRSSSLDLLQQIDAIAEQKALESVHQRALERQASITTDPVNRLQLRYSLVAFYVGKKDLQSAQRNVEALYKENPKILGVVRATADFYWAHGMKPEAIQVILRASGDSYPELKAQFQFEAARKYTEIKSYDQARKILLPLLETSPYNGEYLAAVADTYARAGDNAGLRDFYLQKIDFFRKAQLPEAEKKDRIAGLRRGLIQALTKLQDYAGAIDQYIEVIKAYPTDAGLVTESALYAQKHDRKQQLLQFFNKATADSPKDSRWPVVLAEVEQNFEDYPAAIEALSKAIKIRPDRIDIFTSRAELEERLLRFDEAVADFASIYELDYHNPKWMESVAQIRARQGKIDLAVTALKTALIDGHPEAPGKYFEVADRLAGWNALTPAREYAQKGVEVAGGNLLAESENHRGAEIYARILTRLRQQQTALKTLESSLQVAGVPQKGAEHSGDSLLDAEIRKAAIDRRIETAHSGMTACLREMGTTVDRYFAPEEKVAFAAFITTRWSNASWTEVRDFWIPLAQSAGLAEQEASWRYEILSSHLQTIGADARFEDLQNRRMKFAELGQQLESLGDHDTSQWHTYRTTYYRKAIGIFRLSGDAESELRVYNKLGVVNEDRYYELLLARDPERLIDLASSNFSAVNYAVANGDLPLAYRAISANGEQRKPVWSRAYTALAGLYFDDASPEVRQAFLAALNNKTIGASVGHEVDRDEALAGDVWFDYASRYGEYLGVTKKGEPEDFLPALLEKTPRSSEAYMALASYYEGTSDLARATADYEHVLALNNARIDAHQRLAVIYFKQGNQDQANQEWQTVLAMLEAQAGQPSTPQNFWKDYVSTVSYLGERHLMPQFHVEVNRILYKYVKKNGPYRLPMLLRSTFKAMKEPAESDAAVTWVLELSSNTDNRLNFLSSIVHDNVISLRKQEPIYKAILELAQNEVAKADGEIQKDWARASLQEWQIAWLNYLMQTGQLEEAGKYIESLSQEMRDQKQSDLLPMQLRIAAAQNTLDTVLQGYRNDPDHMPSLDILSIAAKQLQDSGDKKSSRKILELVYIRQIEEHSLTAANMLGLAEIRIDNGDLASALTLLRRMNLVVGEPFANQDAAASLLIRKGHPTEAIPFLQELTRAVPWDEDAQIHLAQAQIAAGQDADKARDRLAAIGSHNDVSYGVRTTAVTALAGSRPGISLGSGELDLPARGGNLSAVDADKPYYFAARVQAASKLDSVMAFTLLRNALQDHPYANTARLPIFRAAIAQQQYYLAIAAVNPLNREGHFVARESEEEGQSDEATSTAPDDSAAETNADDQPVEQNATIDPQMQAEIYEGLGLAYAKTNDLQAAVASLRSAYKVEKLLAKKREIWRQLTEARAILRRRATNAERQPTVREELEQDHLVHPRLVAARKTAAQKSTATKGVAR